MNVPSLADAREHLNLTSSSSELQRVLDASVSVVEGLGVGPLLPRAVSEVRRHLGSPVIVLRTAPVLSVQSVVPIGEDGLLGTAFPAGQFVLEEAAGVVTWLGASRLPYGIIRVEYTAGRAVGQLPPDLHQAVLEQLRHLWESQRGVAPGRLGADTVAASSARGFTVPRRVEQLVAPYVSSFQVA